MFMSPLHVPRGSWRDSVRSSVASWRTSAVALREISHSSATIAGLEERKPRCRATNALHALGPILDEMCTIKRQPHPEKALRPPP